MHKEYRSKVPGEDKFEESMFRRVVQRGGVRTQIF